MNKEKVPRSALRVPRSNNARRSDLRSIRVSIDQAAALSGLSRKTVEIQLAAIGCPVVRGATFSVADVFRAVCGRRERARVRVLEGNAASIERDNKRKDGALYDAAETDAFLGELLRYLFGELERTFAGELPPVLVGQDAAHISARAGETVRELKKGLEEKLGKWLAAQRPGESREGAKEAKEKAA